MSVMFGDFEGENLHVSNGAADDLLKSLGHPGLGMYTSGQMRTAEARRLIDAHTGEKHKFHDDFARVVEAHEKSGKTMLEWA